MRFLLTLVLFGCDAVSPPLESLAQRATGDPVAKEDQYTVNENDILFVNPAAGMLANDSPGSAGPLAASLTTSVSFGTLDANDDGSFSYAPDPGFSGYDVFSYRVTDGTLASKTAAVVIFVNDVDALPSPDADPLSTNGKHIKLAIQRDFGMNVIDNDAMYYGNLAQLYRCLAAMPTGLYTAEMRHISVRYWFNTMDNADWTEFKNGLRRIGVAGMNILTYGYVTDGLPYDLDPLPARSHTFALMIFHELTHNVDARLNQEDHELHDRIATLIASAGTDQSKYIRAVVLQNNGDDYFVRAPQEFTASLANDWFHKSSVVWDYCERSLRDAGNIDLISQCLFTLDVFSQGTYGRDVSYFFETPQSIVPQREGVRVARDARGRVNALNRSGVTFKATLDSTGLATGAYEEYPELMCAPEPRSNCTQAGSAQITVRDKTDNRGDRIKWTWRGAATPDLSGFGDPTQDTRYAFCMYQERAEEIDLISEGRVPPGCTAQACWNGTSSSYAYRGTAEAQDGVARLTLRADQLSYMAKGYLMRTPRIPLKGQITTQLQADSGVCWSASFTADQIRRNVAGSFSAKK